MSNPIFDMLRPRAPQAPQGNIMQDLMHFARTIQGNPEQIVRGLLSSGRMSQQQFDQFSQMARQIIPRNK